MGKKTWEPPLTTALKFGGVLLRCVHARERNEHPSSRVQTELRSIQTGLLNFDGDHIVFVLTGVCLTF